MNKQQQSKSSHNLKTPTATNAPTPTTAMIALTLFRTTTTALLLLALFPSLTTACTCAELPTGKTALANSHAVFRGVVTKKLKSSGAAGYDSASYVVKVAKVFKGCNFKATESIVVTTGGNAFYCGFVDLKVNGTYAFSGDRITIADGIKSQLGKDTKVKRGISASSCNYNIKWSAVTAADLKTLQWYDNSKCVAKCDIGAHCPSSDQYCYKGKCQSLYKACPGLTYFCEKSPCSTIPTCKVSRCDPATPWLCTISEAKCYDDLCTGCNYFLVDATGNRIDTCK